MPVPDFVNARLRDVGNHAFVAQNGLSQGGQLSADRSHALLKPNPVDQIAIAILRLDADWDHLLPAILRQLLIVKRDNYHSHDSPLRCLKNILHKASLNTSAIPLVIERAILEKRGGRGDKQTAVREL
jgi:hypothetical protein